jgi:hypothetical protein
MQKVYTKRLLIVFLVLCFPIAGLLAQTCTTPGANCGSIAQDFNNGAGAFIDPTGQFVHSSGTGDFRASTIAGDNFYLLNSMRYVLNSSGPLTVGYDLSKSTVNPNGIARIFVTVFYEIGNSVFQVEHVINGFCPNICIQVFDPAFQPGLNVVFRITFETTNDANGVGNTLVIDNYSNGAAAAPLPADLKSFTVKRSNNAVVLNWETVSESNVKGFEIQRKLNNGSFERIGFVASKAPNGTSSSLLQYSFTDLNNNSGASQYRIVSIDLDGRMKISIIRSVDGLQGLAKTMVYPNPSSGPVNVVFPDSDSRDIQLTDLVGRVHASWRSYKNQDLILNKLTPGSYMLRVTNVVTRKSEVLRLSVTK